MKPKNPEPSALENEITRLHGELKLHDPETEEYKTIMDSVKVLYDLKDCEKQPKKSISPDTVLLAATNVVGIVIVLAYEHAHPVVSKAFGLVSKLRL